MGDDALTKELQSAAGPLKSIPISGMLVDPLIAKVVNMAADMLELSDASDSADGGSTDRAMTVDHAVYPRPVRDQVQVKIVFTTQDFRPQQPVPVEAPLVDGPPRSIPRYLLLLHRRVSCV